MRRYSFWIVPAIVASILPVCWSPALEFPSQESVAFETTEEFRAFAQRHGFQISSDCKDPELIHNCYLSREPRTCEELATLSKVRCGLTPKWKGIVWVTARFVSAERSQGLLVHSLGGHCRIWGKVLVAGDEEVLIQLEELYRQEKNGR